MLHFVAAASAPMANVGVLSALNVALREVAVAVKSLFLAVEQQAALLPKKTAETLKASELQIQERVRGLINVMKEVNAHKSDAQNALWGALQDFTQAVAQFFVCCQVVSFERLLSSTHVFADRVRALYQAIKTKETPLDSHSDKLALACVQLTLSARVLALAIPDRSVMANLLSVVGQVESTTLQLADLITLAGDMLDPASMDELKIKSKQVFLLFRAMEGGLKGNLTVRALVPLEDEPVRMREVADELDRLAGQPGHPLSQTLATLSGSVRALTHLDAKPPEEQLAITETLLRCVAAMEAATHALPDATHAAVVGVVVQCYHVNLSVCCQALVLGLLIDSFQLVHYLRGLCFVACALVDGSL